MNDLKVFSNSEFGELGVMVIDGKEYFPAKQCASILGYKDTTNAIKQHCKGVVKHHLPTNGGTQLVNYIPEGDLYRLIVSSKLPAAEKFERWIFDTVLPGIRQNGGYISNAEELIARTATAVVSEVMKQLLPLLTANTHCDDMIEEVPQIKVKRRHCKSHSIISHLDAALRMEVEEMLCDARYTYKDIADFLHKKGIKVSGSSLARYYKWLELEI